MHPQGNHYDSTVNGKYQEEEEEVSIDNLKLLSDVAVNWEHKPQVEQTYIQTGDDDELIILYEDEDYFDIVPPRNKKNTSDTPRQSISTSKENSTLEEVVTLLDEPEMPSQINTPLKLDKQTPDAHALEEETIFQPKCLMILL